MPNVGPLAGLRVVEHCGWNGVYAGRLLADGGADVVRVINADDPIEHAAPFLGQSGISVQSTWYNAGKRLIQLDLSAADGRRRLVELCADADILIEDWRPGRPVVTEAELGATNQRLVRLSVTPMGLTGPWMNLRTNDLIANALGGSASVTGAADTPPLSGYGNQTYHTVGMYGAIVALAALRTVRATGKPVHIDLSAHEALTGCTEQVLMQWFFPGSTRNGPIAPRQGSLHWSNAYEVYPSRDGGWVMVTAAMAFMETVLPWMIEDGAAQDLADKGQYPSVLAMVANIGHVMEVMRAWVAGKDADEMMFEAQRRHLPFGSVWNIARILESPQIAARGWIQEREVPGYGTIKLPGRAFATSADSGHPVPPVRVSADSIAWTERLTARPLPPAVGGREEALAPDSSRPLAGVRILDFTHVLAGPFGTRVLADLGADVIKIGTASRGVGANSPYHPYYVCWNRNKRHITLNMSTEQGRDVARRLAAESDIIIENFSAGVLKRWGLDRVALAPTNPGISVVSMGGMGQTGPWSKFVTFAPTIHALVGLTYLTNPPGRHDLGYGFSLTDHLSGLAGAVAVLQALEHRRTTGQGLDIDLSQYELGLSLMGPALIDTSANGTDPQPAGNRHPHGSFAPHGIYRCAGDDRWVAIACADDSEWQRLCALMGAPELATDALFATHTARIANQDALDATVESWTRRQDRYVVQDLCQGAGIAAGAVQNAADLTGADPQHADRNFFGTANCTQWGDYGVDRFPARFNGARPAVYDGVHDLGADTFDVLVEVGGYDDETIASLVADGVLS
jgi:crotonobetainyl-CoA:carnitine CoA-transferase CaiB-like acyl-CoA transferase